MIVHRIATITPAYSADDLSGEGAKASGGRWNSPGAAMVYCAENRALAILETFVHVDKRNIPPMNRYFVTIDLPDDLVKTAEVLTSPPPGWNAEPAGVPSIAYGDAWVAAKRSAVLVVPSVIVPDEYNYLLNPLHAQARRITARIGPKCRYDQRLFSARV